MHRHQPVRQLAAGPISTISALVALPNKKIVSASTDLTIKIWDENGECILNIISEDAEQEGTVLCLLVLSDNRLVTGSEYGFINLYYFNLHFNNYLKTTLKKVDEMVRALTAFPNGHFASGQSDSITLWQPVGIESKSWSLPLALLTLHCMVAIYDDWVAIGLGNNTIQIRNLQNDQPIILLGHTNSVFALTMYNNFLVSASNDQTIKIWNLSTGAVIKNLEGHHRSIYSLLAVPQKRLLVSGADDGKLIFWDMNNFTSIERYQQHPSAVEALAFSNDKVFSGSNTIRTWLTNYNPRALPPVPNFSSATKKADNSCQL